MKKSVLLALFSLLLIAAQSQTPHKSRYTVSAGLLGGANYAKFHVKNNANVTYKYSLGYTGGLWLNFPIIGKTISLEPQAQYSLLSYNEADDMATVPNNVNIGYISVPLLLKFHLGSKIDFMAGPQVDFRATFKDKNNVYKEKQFANRSFALTGGIEFFPHDRLSIYGRYFQAFTAMHDKETNDNPYTVGAYYNQGFQAGLKYKLFGKKIPADTDGDGVNDKEDKCPTVVGLVRYNGCPIPDTDADGINDEEDKCPTVAGLAKYNGCPIPDTDKDGINDEQDKCPNVAGLAKYNGCPIPDTDGDSINDEQDKCPTVAGVARYQGCPVPDRDGDGINDEEDKCPDVAGVASNQGCPVITQEMIDKINYHAKNIYFVTGSTKLMSKSFASLDEVVKMLNEHPHAKVKIDGHTDNVGNDASNMKLSDGRAASVKSYLTSKGITEDRLQSEGFGETKPIADNKTAAGRAQNRRVEMNLFQ